MFFDCCTLLYAFNEIVSIYSPFDYCYDCDKVRETRGDDSRLSYILVRPRVDENENEIRNG